jgi:cell division protein FtsB
MKEVDESALKAEIDEISKKIDAIVQNIDRMDPDKQDGGEGHDQPAS